MQLELDGQSLTFAQLVQAGRAGTRVTASDSARKRVDAAAEFCQAKADTDEAHYGINTGFGVLAKQRISRDALADLQRNLLRSHAVGRGTPLSREIVRLMMVLRVNSLLRGHSGVSLDLIDLFLALVNADLIPVVPEYGSVGASGDLAPLAHMALPLIGEGALFVGDDIRPAAEVMAGHNLLPIRLRPKEGLALINGTQLMSAFAVKGLLQVRRHIEHLILSASMSIDAYQATDTAFDQRIQQLKAHPGQIAVASSFRRVLAGSGIMGAHHACGRVQDPYSFRCIPQVFGAVLDTCTWVEEWVLREVNAVTDNPLIFVEDGDIVSGGNFHGEHMAIALDALAVAACELGSITERRIDKLLDNDTESLPPCLVSNPGLNSGLMVTQYLAAALVSENKVHAHPAAVDSIPTSAGFEDHVSMGSISALKLVRITDNIERIVAVELLAAAQALEFHRPLESSATVEAVHAAIRSRVPFIERDCVLSEHLTSIEDLMGSGVLLETAKAALGATILAS